jgi:3',5'-cyclic AMP phosphodiesterase CpdA
MPEVKKETKPAYSEPFSGPEQKSPSGQFLLAHVSDLHLTTLENIKIPQLLNKRILGYLSWWRKRRIIHRLDIVEAMLADLQAIHPSHIAVTGDLTHIGLPHEFTEAGQWLTRLGPPKSVTVIPGNHEAYAGLSWAKACTMWGPYLASDLQQPGPKTAGFFPSLRVRGQVALIGLCSARPSLPFLAVGSLGKQQLANLEGLLEQTGERGLLRIILIHHPPVPRTTKWRKRLVDNRAFAEVLARHGAELVLHGHTHATEFSMLPGPVGNIPVVGAASASEFSPKSKNRATYNLYTINRTGQDWRVTLHVRGFSENRGQFITVQETALALPQDGACNNLVS